MHVLVVEDHDASRELLERFLTRWGHNVAAAETLRGGLDLLHTERFDAIVSDIVLPDGTGYALMSEARRNGIKALAIAVSEYNYPSDVEEAKVTGFDYHLNKPFDQAELRSLLEQASG